MDFNALSITPSPAWPWHLVGRPTVYSPRVHVTRCRSLEHALEAKAVAETRGYCYVTIKPWCSSFDLPRSTARSST